MTGSFNGYEEPAEMIPVKEFTAFVDKRKTEYMEHLKKNKIIPRDSTLYIHLDDTYR